MTTDDRHFAPDKGNAPPEHRPTAADLRRARQPHRGRDAHRPRPSPQRGWKSMLLRVKRKIVEDQFSLVAAGVAFYLMLALFPGLLALVAIYGAVADPRTVSQQMTQLMAVMPVEAAKLVGGQLQEITQATGSKAGLGAAVAILMALWSASNGAQALISGLNLAYDEEERRGFFALRAAAMLLTVGVLLFLVVSLGAITVLPPLLVRLPLGAAAKAVAYVVTWALMAALVLVAFATAYRFGPSREHPRWKWLSPGSVLAAVLWLLASLAFSFYASHFGSFNKTYGTLAGAIVLLLWLQITAYVTLLGAEVDAEVEHPTARDTTTGLEEPPGERNATVADKVGVPAGGQPGADDGNWQRRPRPLHRSTRATGGDDERAGPTRSRKGSGPR
jgi:membrane protein